jgi:hypothetical protein
LPYGLLLVVAILPGTITIKEYLEILKKKRQYVLVLLVE